MPLFDDAAGLVESVHVETVLHPPVDGEGDHSQKCTAHISESEFLEVVGKQPS